MSNTHLGAWEEAMGMSRVMENSPANSTPGWVTGEAVKALYPMAATVSITIAEVKPMGQPLVSSLTNALWCTVMRSGPRPASLAPGMTRVALEWSTKRHRS
jgi:hypothetical protein